MHILTHTTDIRTTQHRFRRAAWWSIAVLTALAVLLAHNEVVTATAIWAAFAVATRLEVVARRRARRAKHRAETWERIATLDAVHVANAHSSADPIAVVA